MTIYDAISAAIYPYNVDDALIEKVCIDSDMSKDSEYSKADKLSVAKATIAILRNLITLSSESDAGYSLSYDVNKLKERIFAIATDNGLADVAEEFDTRSRIIDKTALW